MRQGNGGTGRRRERGGIFAAAAMTLGLLAAQAALGQAAITITPWSLSPLTGLPGGISGDAYPVIHFVASGGTAPYTWSATGLPPGLTLNPNTGTLGGTPASSGDFTVTVTATDSATPTPLTGSRDFAIGISGNLVLTVVSPGTVPAIPLNTPYTLQLSARGGTPPYTWSLSDGTLPTGLTLTAGGQITGKATAQGVYHFTVQVRDSVAATAALPLALTAGSALPRVGVFSQIASGGGWTTSLYLINNSKSPVTFAVNFYKDDGTPLALPELMTMPDGGTSGASAATGTSGQIDANSTVLIQMVVQYGDAFSGWADVTASGPLQGYGVFDYMSIAHMPSEGTVPLETAFESSFDLPYDNTNGAGTAVALTNLGTSSTSVVVTVTDAAGTRLAEQPVSVAGNGHTSFLLTNVVAAAAGNRGTIRFASDNGANIGGLGLRIGPNGGYTSLPHLAAQQ